MSDAPQPLTPPDHADLAAALEMLRSYEAIMSDPFKPYESSTDGSGTHSDVACCGCGAHGESRWPKWEIAIEHEPGCRWLAYRRVLDRV